MRSRAVIATLLLAGACGDDDRDDDIWSLGGEDFSIDPGERSAARQLGQSVRTAAHDGDGAQAVLAYHCEDEAGAEHNAAALRTVFEDGESVRSRQPWSELVSVADVDVDGRTVVVTLDVLDGRSPMFALQAIFIREPFTVSP